jgi:hypothetical protein
MREDRPERLVLVGIHADRGRREYLDQSQQRNEHHGAGPFELLRRPRPEEPDAHAEEGGDEHEIDVEPEHAHIGGDVPDQGQFQEEDQERVAGQPGGGATLGAVRGGRSGGRCHGVILEEGSALRSVGGTKGATGCNDARFVP